MQNNQFITIINQEPGYYGKGHTCSIICRQTDLNKDLSIDIYSLSIMLLAIIVGYSVIKLIKTAIKHNRIKFRVL